MDEHICSSVCGGALTANPKKHYRKLSCHFICVFVALCKNYFCVWSRLDLIFFNLLSHMFVVSNNMLACILNSCMWLDHQHLLQFFCGLALELGYIFEIMFRWAHFSVHHVERSPVLGCFFDAKRCAKVKLECFVHKTLVLSHISHTASHFYLTSIVK